MKITQIVMIGLVSAVLSIVLKEKKPEMSLFIGLAAGIIIFLIVLSGILPVINLIEELTAQAHVNQIYLNIVLKILGIAYLTEFASQILKDANETNIASKVEFGGKVLILLQAVPVVKALMELVINII